MACSGPILGYCVEKMGADRYTIPFQATTLTGKEGAREKINCSYSSVQSGPHVEGRYSNGGSYSKQQNNCRLTFWHSFVGMIHYDDVPVQDNAEEITGHDHTAKCCNTVIG